MRFESPWLVGYPVVLAMVLAPPPAAGQPSAEASNVRGVRATQGSNHLDLPNPLGFDTRDAPWRRLGDFNLPDTDTLELEVPTMLPCSGFRLERHVGDELTFREPLRVDDVDSDEELKKHHVGVQAGLFNPSTDVIELGNLGFRVERSDGLTILRYRYSLNPRIDLVAEGRYWTGRGPTATSGEGKVAGGFLGPGIRVHAPRGTTGRRVVPYLQGNVYYVQEMLGEPKVLYKNGGFGFGLSGGVDVEVTRLISFPIEATYVGNGGGGLDDLSGFGVSVGVNFNF